MKDKKSKIKNKYTSFLFLSFSFIFLSFVLNSYAKEIAIIYSGETHAMIYPCNCPIEPDGGVARRASLVQEIRKNHPEALLLDTGNFFAGGLIDDYTQGTELDTKRTLINLKSMGIMKYDAVALGEDELNLGKGFFEKEITDSGLKVISCNARLENTLPYIIKEISGVKIGIIGVTSPLIKEKAPGSKLIDPEKAVKECVAELKKKGTGIIVLLSNLDEDENLRLINNIEGIDVLIEGRGSSQDAASINKKGTLIVRTAWQGRHLGKLLLNVEKGKITSHKTEDLRLSDKIKDDPAILKILPQCFSDINCKKKGFIGSCSKAGEIKAACEFTKAPKVELIIVTPKECSVCNTLSLVTLLKKRFPGLETTYFYYPEKNAKDLIKELDIEGLPAYIFTTQIEKEKGFEEIKKKANKKGKFYLLKPEYAGISYYQNRERIEGRLDLFISLYDKGIKGLFLAVRDLKPSLHFLAVEDNGNFDAKNGSPEVEEYLRAVCVQKYYPDIFWDYLICRAKDIKSTWWEDCLGKLDSSKIKACARGKEGQSLLKQNIGLNKELQVMFGPVFLTDNQEIFGIEGKATREELKKVLKK